MSRYVYIILIGIFILGCSPSRVGVENLQLKDNRYYLKNANKPFSGKVISKFEDGSISNIIELKNGIPDGKWVAFGFGKEIVQEGSYSPIEVKKETEFAKTGIRRLNVCTTKEGSIEFTDVFLITDKIDKDDGSNIKDLISLYLKDNSIPIKGDTINEIRYVVGELEK